MPFVGQGDPDVMSGKSDVVDNGIVQRHSAWALRSDNRQRDGCSGLPALRLEHFSNTLQNERSRRAALACRSRLELAVHAGCNVDRRAHDPSCHIYGAPRHMARIIDTQASHEPRVEDAAPVAGHR